MKPFNLEAAKNGEPICDESGNTVKYLAHFDKDHFPEINDDYRVLVFWPNGKLSAYAEYGHATPGSMACLYMADKPKVKRSGWIAIMNKEYKDQEAFPNWFRSSSHVFSSKEEACSCNGGMGIAAIVKVEWEEES